MGCCLNYFLCSFKLLEPLKIANGNQFIANNDIFIIFLLIKMSIVRLECCPIFINEFEIKNFSCLCNIFQIVPERMIYIGC